MPELTFDHIWLVAMVGSLFYLMVNFVRWFLNRRRQK